MQQTFYRQLALPGEPARLPARVTQALAQVDNGVTLLEPCLGHLLQSAHDIGTSALKHTSCVATRAGQNMVVSEEV